MGDSITAREEGLRKRERDQDRREAEWKQDTANREREIVRLAGIIESLSQREKPLEVTINRLTAERDTLNALVFEKQAKIGYLERTIDFRTVKLAETNQGMLDANAEWINAAAKASAESVTEANRLATLIAEKTVVLEAMIETEKDLQTEKDQIARDIDGAQLQLADVRTVINETKDTAIADLEAIDKKKQTAIQELELVEAAADEQRKQLVGIRAENDRLTRENVEFHAYEDRAWKVLNAKDESLQDRERTVAQREHMSPRSPSFLPPVNE